MAETDQSLSDSERRDLSRLYADRAMDGLRQALASGWKDVDRLKKDPDLQPLHSLQAFQLLAQSPENQR